MTHGGQVISHLHTNTMYVHPHVHGQLDMLAKYNVTKI